MIPGASPPEPQTPGPEARPRALGAGDQTAALLRLLQLEADVRRIETLRELVFHMANESRSVLPFRQACVFLRRRGWRLEAVSSVNAFDPQAPLNRALRAVVAALPVSEGDGDQRIDLTSGGHSDALSGHAFPHLLWLPMRARSGAVFAGLLLLRETPWPETILPLARRVADTYAHAWEALAGPRVGRRIGPPRRILWPLVGATLLALGFVQAPLSVLAPAEVTGRDRTVVAAALNGVVEEVLVAPNALVEAGALLARYDDTELRNALEIADRETIVARARLEMLQSAAFTDRAAARELKVAEAQLELALAESALARERLAGVELRAPRAGLAVFADAGALVGRPVTIGERLMEIVDPLDLEFTLRLPVDDSIVLREGARLRVFLDSNPLDPVPGVLTRRSYRATLQDDGSFAYTLTARAPEGALAGARIGAQGTAQVFGERHSIYFIVFRRPYSWLRQRLGL
ncbi:MAG: HlyD family efflux transporter periplasmic adaptor subunit [Rhodobacteraceae bacterium]|nr:MAG: HlyD family efflux transporter periplasmic adaptor subunit [Paracoccaceae bacterium]